MLVETAYVVTEMVFTFVSWPLFALLAAIQLQQCACDSLGAQQAGYPQGPSPHQLTPCLVYLHTHDRFQLKKMSSVCCRRAASRIELMLMA